MKKNVILTALAVFVCLVLLLGGCSQNGRSDQLDVGTFSYTEDYTTYKDEPGVKHSGFVNTEKTELKDTRQAVKLAKKECLVEYDTISVAFDENSAFYRVSFYKKGWCGGGQTVYIDRNGVTQLMVYGE